MRKAKKKLTKHSSAARKITKKSIRSKKPKPLAKGASLSSKLEKEFLATLTTLHNTANKKFIEFSKQVKLLKSKLTKTLSKKSKALLQQQIKVAESAHKASQATKQKLSALKATLQKFEKDWSKKQAIAAKKAATAAAKAKMKASSKKKKARRPAKPSTVSPKPTEGFGSTSYTPSPAPFGQTHTMGGTLGGQQHHY